jgi:hypothetical protein
VLFFTSKGHFKVTFNMGGVTLKVVMPIHNQMVNGRLLPKIDVSTFQVAFDSHKINISLSGGIIADVASFFVWIFKNTIIHNIANQINSQVGPALNNKIHESILAANGILHLGPNLAFDMQFPISPIITADKFGLYLNATYFNPNKPYKIPAEAVISDVSLDFSSTNEIMVTTSSWSADSFLGVFHDLGIFDFKLTPERAGSESNLLNTNFIDTMLPGIKAKFGENQPVTLRMFSNKGPQTYFHPGTLGIHINYDLHVYVNSDLACSFRIIDDDGAISLSLTKGLLVVQLLQLYMNDAVVLTSQFGEIDVWSKRVFINWSIKLATPFINAYLATGV